MAFAVGIGDEVAEGTAVSGGFGTSSWVVAGMASIVAETAARTVAAISGVGVTVVAIHGVWVGSAVQEVAERASRMATVTPRNTESLRRWI